MTPLHKAFFESVSRAKILDLGIGFNAPELIAKSRKQALLRAELLNPEKPVPQIEIALPQPLEVPKITQSFSDESNASFGKILGFWLTDLLFFVCFFTLVYIVSRVLPFPPQLVEKFQASRAVNLLQQFSHYFGLALQLPDILAFVFSYICFGVFQAFCALVAGCTFGQSCFSLVPLQNFQSTSPFLSRITLFLYIPALFFVSFAGLLFLPFILIYPKNFPYFFDAQ